VMDEMGKAMMGTGEATGENRAIDAAEQAIANPLLDEISLEGARGVLINITGGYDLTLFELDEAANKIREKVDPDANIIVGSTLDPNMEGAMRVSVVATGIDASAGQAEAPLPRRSMSAPLTQTVSAEQPAAEPAPAPAPAPVAETAADDRTLFDDAFEADTAQDDGFDGFEPHVEDDLPPPAYQPRPETQFAPAEAFVAPRAPAPGTPSPEALARLEAAVRKPSAPAAPAAPSRAVEAEAPRRGFGINNLINRMTGHSEAEPAQSAPSRAQPQVQAVREEAKAADPEQERIEIPAFLRRQAN